MIEPEAVAPAPRSRRHRQAVLAGVAALAVTAAGVAVVAGGGRAEPKPLALMAGAGDSAPERTPAPAALPAVETASADSRAFAPYPYGGFGVTFRVDDKLPDLPGHAADWRVSGPVLDRAAVARIAGALGLAGTPVARDGGWSVDDGDRTLAANPAGGWSISYYRSRVGPPDDAAAAPPTGPALSPAEAERRVRDLVDRIGAPDGQWTVEVTETGIGVGWACAAPAPAPALSPEELTKAETDKLRLEQNPPDGPNSATAVAAPTATGGIPAAPCPPPPAPVKGFNVALYPLLDGHRADWGVWNATLRSDGRVENLSGSWATFERGADYRLRGVDAALKDLGAAPQPAPLGAEGIAVAPMGPTPAVATPAIAACPVVATPVPSDKPVASGMPGCLPPVPQAIILTGVELALIQAPVAEDGRARLHLVPAYRFLGHFDNGTPWQTSVIALHPDAIAPPPGIPVPGHGGKAVPPAPGQPTAR